MPYIARPCTNAFEGTVIMSMLEVGREIRALRNRLGRTLGETACAAGISSGFLSKVERGCAYPSLVTLGDIASVLGVSVAHLLELFRNQEAGTVRQLSPVSASSRARTVR
ncbi:MULTISPECIES: helix-turn-helix transcriptional regulator [unclassified Paraburkholderia]|uniref:helix-turn-helix domain-containing protein n=1 Tax=unclassified Paraburkholderia TaxID=2615204 RepID=UPI002AAF7007|nr:MULTISPECIES: helix-turn-helix transcriptional regulator [unclassified Paraburkholderia]